MRRENTASVYQGKKRSLMLLGFGHRKIILDHQYTLGVARRPEANMRQTMMKRVLLVEVSQ